MAASRFLCIFWATAFVTVTAQDAGRPTVPAPAFEHAPCPFTADAKVLDQLRCGYLTVPENRTVPDGRRLRLAVATLKSLSLTPRPDPVVLLAGGPGNAAVVLAPNLVTDGRMDALRALVK